jgi:hypothetical protein
MFVVVRTLIFNLIRSGRVRLGSRPAGGYKQQDSYESNCDKKFRLHEALSSYMGKPKKVFSQMHSVNARVYSNETEPQSLSYYRQLARFRLSFSNCL